MLGKLLVFITASNQVCFTCRWGAAGFFIL